MASLTDSRPDLGSDTRVHGLDALRAGALLLGIGLHSLLPFLPGLPWLVSDTRSTWLAGVPVYVIHLFRMALFMLLAGYFGRLTLQRRGPGRYLRDRMIRILLPLVVFWPVAVLSLGVLAVINAQANGIPLVVPPPPQGPPLLMINPGQLWFLLVLMQCVAIMLAIRGLAVLLLGTQRCRQLAAWCGGLLSHPAGGLLAAVPYTAALILQGTVLGGIIAPAPLLPSLPPVTAYLGAFTVGWALHARADAMTRIARFWPVHLTGAVVLSAIGLSHSDPGS
ncbi:MAG: acyltransferase family protein, partial [Microlunatus sp.]|nr:acyltransferase family protein [Microlunatus sp.]